MKLADHNAAAVLQLAVNEVRRVLECASGGFQAARILEILRRAIASEPALTQVIRPGLIERL